MGKTAVGECPTREYRDSLKRCDPGTRYCRPCIVRSNLNAAAGSSEECNHPAGDGTDKGSADRRVGGMAVRVTQKHLRQVALKLRTFAQEH